MTADILILYVSQGHTQAGEGRILGGQQHLLGLRQRVRGGWRGGGQQHLLGQREGQRGRGAGQ